MKKKIRTKTIYTFIVSAILVFLYFCHGDNYLILWKGIPSIVFFLISCLLVTPLLLYKNSIGDIFKNQLLMFTIIFIIVTLLWVFISLSPIFNLASNIKYIKTQILSFFIMFVCMVFFSNEKNVKMTLKIMVYGVLLGVVLNVYDILHIDNYYLASGNPHDRSAFSMVFARAAGFYLDPNVAASALVMGLILTEPIIKNKRKKLLYVITVGAAVMLTLSLSGVLFYGVYFFLRFIYGKVKFTTILVVLLVFVTTSLAIRDLMKKGVIHFGPGITTRIMAITNPFGTNEDIVDNNSRTILFRNAFEMIEEDPVFGKGVGQHQFVETEQNAKSRSGTHAGPHNQWLAFMIDYGIIPGLLIFTILFIILIPANESVHRKEVFYFILIYFLYSLFSHTSIKNHSLMFLLPLVYKMGRIIKQ